MLNASVNMSTQEDWEGASFVVILGVAFSPNLPSSVAWVLEDGISFLRLCEVYSPMTGRTAEFTSNSTEHLSDEVLPR